MLSLRPNSLAKFTQYWRSDTEANELGNTRMSASAMWKLIAPDYDYKPLERLFHNFAISPNAHRTIKKKINWLFYLAKPQAVTTPNGKNISNFKIAFLTFTLPSTQRHPTTVITSELWNHMLTELRRSTGMKNYVWRLEFQKNGNVHYHLVTDTFVKYQHALRIWNRIIEKLDYVSEYQNKMKSLSFPKYCENYKGNIKKDFNKVRERYNKGTAENWSNPNSVDVKSVKSGQNIGGYIAKYFSKSKESNPVCNPRDNADNSKALRLWFCSQSLSKLKTVTFFIEELAFNLYELVKSDNDVFEFTKDFVNCLFFDINKLSQKLANWLNKRLFQYAVDVGYLEPIPQLI